MTRQVLRHALEVMGYILKATMLASWKLEAFSWWAHELRLVWAEELREEDRNSMLQMPDG